MMETNGSVKQKPLDPPLMKRQTQAKPRREEAHGRELADLKRENNQLKRLVSRLRKEIERLELMSLIETEPSKSPKVEYKKSKRLACPSCDDSHLTTTTTPSGKKIYVCKSCQWFGQLDTTLN